MIVTVKVRVWVRKVKARVRAMKLGEYLNLVYFFISFVCFFWLGLYFNRADMQ